MKTRILFLITFVALCCSAAMAQLHVKGTVVSAKDSEPMIGVAVLEQGTSNGQITDLDGKFSIQVKNNATLVISYVGYKTQTVKVNGRSTVNVRLEEDAKVLDEVVVVGYGVQKKSDLTGSVASVGAKDLKGLATTDAAAALQGKAAGVQILNASGAPGNGAEIRVRGYSSNSGNIGPLLIVDGLKVSSIQYLDPSLIESMEVLKDAASAAIYGSEAGNGVVIITTKNGGKGNGKITYSARFTMNQLGKAPKLLNATQFKDWMEMQGKDVNAAIADVKRDYNWDETTDTDWLDACMENSWSKQHSLSLQGGNDRGQYFANLTYTNQDGIVKGHQDYYERLTAQVNADYKIKDWLQVGTNTSIEKWRRGSVSETGYGTAFEMLLTMDPLTPVYWTDRSQYLNDTGAAYDKVQNGTSKYNYRFYGDNNGLYATSYFNTELAGGNPFGQRDRNANNKNEGINVHGTFFANLTPIKDLVITSRFGYRITQGNTYNYTEPYYITSRVSGTTYNLSQATSTGLYYQWENFANYTKKIGKHNISAMAGMSYIQNESKSTNAGASGEILLSSYDPNFRYLSCVLSDKEKVSRTFGGVPGKSTNISYFGRLGYSYDNRYNLQANFRADAFDSSKLSADKRWGYFPSLSAGWTISNEKFFRDLVPDNILSFAKLRASWGRNGNINVLGGYKYTATIATGGQWYQYGNGTAVTLGSMPSGIANPNLTWETSDQLDFGLDLRFFNDALTIGMDYYKKSTKDLLVDAPCLPETGVSSQMINAGKVENKGFEFEATYKGKVGDLNYSVSGNFATLKNNVTYLDSRIPRIGGGTVSGNISVLQTNFEQGMPVWYMRGYKYVGKDENNKPLFLTLDGEKVNTPGDKDMFNIGKGIPDVTYGVTVNLEYKGFDFSAFGTGTIGNDVYYGMYRTGYNNISKKIYDMAKNGTMPDPATVAGAKYYWSSSAMVFDGSFFKIKQMQLGYTIPRNITKKAFIENLRCYVSLDDFFTFTSYPGLDPEIAARSGNNVGLDAGAYPTMRKMTFGLNVTF